MTFKFLAVIIQLVLLVSFANCSKDKEESPRNQSPTCKIITPADGQQITKGEFFIIIAEADDSDGSIIEVRFFIDDVEKGADTNNLAKYIWNTGTVNIGPHTIKATSFDNEGSSATDEISVIITDSVFGSVFDPRDGQEYKIVEIGSQTWFAENLNYETPNSAWYDNEPEYGAIYGRLYPWDDALFACPAGWHLPGDDEWKTLEMYLGMSQNEADQVGYRGTDEGSKLKSTSGWVPNNGSNSSRFNGLPGGVGIDDIQFQFRGTIGSWWVANEYDDELAWSRMMSGDYDNVWRGYGNKGYAYAVRCIKD